MTISNILTEKSFTPAAGSNQTFSLGFEVFEASDIVMFFDGIRVTSGFTVLPSTNQVTVNSDPGFDSSKTLTFRRVLNRTQGTALANNQVLDVDEVEAALDRVTALHHQGMTIDDDGNLDASKLVDTTYTPRRITNVADGIAFSDAATVGQLAQSSGLTFVNSIAGEGGTSLTGDVTLDTDDIGEGSSNLYHTASRAAAAAPVQTITSSGSTITVTQPSTGTFNIEAVPQNTGGTVPVASGDDKFIVTSSGAYVLESGATARTSLGVGAGDNVAFNRVTANENLVVAGTSSLTGNVTASGNVTVTGTVSAEQLTSTDDLTVNDDAAIGGQLTVAEETILTGALKGSSSNKVGVNIASADADGMLHVVEATAGSVVAPTTGNLLVLETDDTSNGLTILQPNPSGSDRTANIFFGKVDDNDSGGITYTHNQTNRNQDTLSLNFGGLSAVFDANGGSNNQELILPSTTKIKNVTTPAAASDAANKSYIDNLLPTYTDYPYAVFHTAKSTNKTHQTVDTYDNSLGSGPVNSFNSLVFDTSLDKSGTTDIALSGSSGITLAANGVYKVEFFGSFCTVQQDFAFMGALANPYLALVTEEKNAANTATLISIGQYPTSSRIQDNGTAGNDPLAVPVGGGSVNNLALFEEFIQVTMSDILVTSSSAETIFPTIVTPVQEFANSFKLLAHGVFTVQRLDVVR